MGFTSNIPEIAARLRRVPDAAVKTFTKKIENVLHEINKEIQAPYTTPVWSGLAVRNMIWSANTPNTNEFPAEGGGAYGESRRPPNETAAAETLQQIVIRRPFKVYWLSNAARHIVDLEHGLLPSPERNRVPSGGMFGTTYASVLSRLRAGVL